MSSKRKKIRSIKKAFGKTVNVVLLAAIVCLAAFWARPFYPQVEKYFSRFGRSAIDTTQVDAYYDLLSRHAPPSKAGLVRDLGVGETEKIQVVADKLKNAMGLGDYTIYLSTHDAAKPPAYIRQLASGHMGILISTKVTERREETNLLVHELGHIYIWSLDRSVFGECDEEKLNDCAGVYLGLGILMLNGLTDEGVRSLTEGYEERKKFYGYITPGQIGYLLARYCADHRIAEESVLPYLTPTGRKYFDAGRGYLKKNPPHRY